MTISPQFTYHSFKFVEISGFPVEFELDEVIGVRYSEIQITSKISTDVNEIAALATNIEDAITANFISVPTNSPSSSERVAWLEPAGLFSLTALYNFDGRSFYKKWLRDVRASQASNGAYSNVAPNVNKLGDASPGSGFAPILIAYNLYRFYGDIEVLEENYLSNQNWLKYVISSNPDFLFTRNINKDYGDYANVNAETPKEVISTAYFAYGTLLMSYISKVLNKTADAEEYDALHQNISKAFVKTYVNATDGKINEDTQTGYVMALVSKVLPEDLIPKAVKNLVENIKVHNDHLTTGYVGK